MGLKVLVFGGTQFMGRITVEALLKEGHEVIMINRGRTASPFGNHRAGLTTVRCDRMGDREKFKTVVREQGRVDAVIDFVGFQEVYLADAVEALTTEHPDGRKTCSTKHYIFLSTDSVYWAQKVPTADRRISEESVEDFTPPEFDEHMMYCKKTSLGEYQIRYGGNKLGCERVLEEAWKSASFPFTTLRLPDVYGPYDNLGGFWELVNTIEERRPVATLIPPERMRPRNGKDLNNPDSHHFSWAFAEDVRDAILASLQKGPEVYGMTMNVAHEESVNLRDTAQMIGEALGLGANAVRFDPKREASLPSTDFGGLDISRALRLLRPWRPTPIRQSVQKAVRWFTANKENRRYHRLVHREPRSYDSTGTRRVSCAVREVKTVWAEAPEKAAALFEGPVLLSDSMPGFTGHGVLSFMQRLMDEVGQHQVAAEVQRGTEVERQTHPLRHFAGHLLPQSEHTAAYRLDSADVLAETTLLPQMCSPVGAGSEADQGRSLDRPPRRLLLGGVGARSGFGRSQHVGMWDCSLLGRRKWRIFPPDTPMHALCADGPESSPVDVFTQGPDVIAVAQRFGGFSPPVCWEAEQCMGDAVVIPPGWWFQTYDDDRTLSLRARYIAAAAANSTGGYGSYSIANGVPKAPFVDDPNDPEVIEFELVD